MGSEPDKKTDVPPALEAYAKWRPRLKRGLGWGLTTATMGKIVGGRRLEGLEIPVLGGLAGSAGLAGAIDAKLEEKTRADPKLKHIADRAFDEHAYKPKDDTGALMNTYIATKGASATDKKAASAGDESDLRVDDPALFSPQCIERAELSHNGILGQLFAHKDEVGEAARKQLGQLLPDAQTDSYGRAVRLKPGNGAIEALFAGYQPRAV